MASGHYHDIIQRDITHHDLIHFALFSLQGGGFTKLSSKIHPTFANNLHIFWFDFSKVINLY